MDFKDRLKNLENPNQAFDEETQMWLMIHTLCKTYGWTIDYVTEELSIPHAYKLFEMMQLEQEILNSKIKK